MMGGLTERGAIMACGGMAVMYVGILYSPTLIFRRPPPTSFYNYMIRRFICAFFSSLLALLLSYLLLTSALPTGSWTLTSLFSAYGVRSDHFLLALVSSFSLTCLIYAGNFVLNSLLLFDLWSGSPSFSLASLSRHIYSIIISLASDIGAWRNLIVAPITEELVFRACMIPLLLCGGFKPLNIVFFCPLFFSLAFAISVLSSLLSFIFPLLFQYPKDMFFDNIVFFLELTSHLNHLLEFYRRKNFSVLKTSLAVGTQLAYTLVFGSYASYLFIRTGHLVTPLVAHVVCNSMGLPVVYSKRGLVVSLAFIGGAAGFLWLIIPLTDPALYNFKNDDCRCWQGYSTLSCNR